MRAVRSSGAKLKERFVKARAAARFGARSVDRARIWAIVLGSPLYRRLRRSPQVRVKLKLDGAVVD
jgi:hypothetical protein